MNTDFPRILALLRKENGYSQKKVAGDLGIAQALLSHYEKGKRECGLEFLVKAADYYNVSTDYLLGRSAVSTGTVIGEDEFPERKMSDKAYRSSSSLTSALAKKLITSSVDVIFSLLDKAKNVALTQNATNMIYLTIYRVFRLLHKTNPNNDKNFFSLPEDLAMRSASANTSISEGKAIVAIHENTNNSPQITTHILESEYDKNATALLTLVKNCENMIK